jgi:hypothetical protein
MSTTRGKKKAVRIAPEREHLARMLRGSCDCPECEQRRLGNEERWRRAERWATAQPGRDEERRPRPKVIVSPATAQATGWWRRWRLNREERRTAPADASWLVCPDGVRRWGYPPVTASLHFLCGPTPDPYLWSRDPTDRVVVEEWARLPREERRLRQPLGPSLRPGVALMPKPYAPVAMPDFPRVEVR